MTARFSARAGRIALLAAVVALPAALAAEAPASSNASRYRVLAATATAQLDFQGGDDTTFSRGRATVAAVLPRRSAGRVLATLGRSASILVPLSARWTESTLTSARTGGTGDYSEPRPCRTARSRRARGGLLVRRVGARVEVRWAFPHAGARSCPGPGGVGGQVRAKMLARIPASRIAARRVTLALSGTARIDDGRFGGIYRWRARVTLVRA